MPENKRVLFITSSAPMRADDATSPFILNMAQDLAALGWEVEILAPHAAGLEREEVLGGVRVHRFRYLLPESMQTLCYQGGAVNNLSRNRFNYLKVPFYVLAQWNAVQRLIRKRNIKILHSHWVLPQGIVADFVARTHLLPHVASIHGSDVTVFRNALTRKVIARVLAHASAVISNSEYLKQLLSRQMDTCLFHVIPVGATPEVPPTDLERSQFAAADEKLLVFAGRLTEQKGIGTLLQAVKQLNETMPVNLLVLGEGPEKHNIEKYISENGLEGKVHLVGTVPNASVPAYLQLADVFVCPSIQTRDGQVEAQGNSIIEAMFAGVPVVATNTGGIPESVIDGRTGLLVEQKNTAALAEAIARVLNDDALQETLRAGAREHATKHFSRYESARKISVIYESLVS